MRTFYYVDEGGILCYPDGRVMTPSEAAKKINKLIKERDEVSKELKKEKLEIANLRGVFVI